MVVVVAEVLHEYVVAPETVNVVAVPEQIVALFTVTVGVAFTVTVEVAVEVQVPLAPVNV